MTKNQFRNLHSRLIMHVQCIENDLRLIYAAIKKGDFEDNFDDLDKAPLYRILKELKKVDYSDGYPDLSNEDYEILDGIREMRNYWCHQCYIDYVYIQNDAEREKVFQNIAQKLQTHEAQTDKLQEKTENIRLKKLKEYDRI